MPRYQPRRLQSGRQQHPPVARGRESRVAGRAGRASGRPPDHILGEGAQGRGGLGIGQAIEIVERQPHVLLGELPGVVECARVFQERPQPAARVGFRVRKQAANPRHGRRIGQAQEPDDRESQLLLLEVGPQALAGGPFFTPDIEHVVGDLKCDAQVAAVVVECATIGSEAPNKRHRAGTRRPSIRPSCPR